MNEFATIYPELWLILLLKTEAALLANPEADAIWELKIWLLGALQACEALGGVMMIMVGIDGIGRPETHL